MDDYNYNDIIMMVNDLMMMMGGGESELYTCPYPPKVHACPPRDPDRLTSLKPRSRDDDDDDDDCFTTHPSSHSPRAYHVPAAP